MKGKGRKEMKGVGGMEINSKGDGGKEIKKGKRDMRE